MSLIHSNIWQAAIFGIWHYHGIPSGLPGVALTFVYGLVMGLLMDYGGGLLLPILAHSIADYFIFVVIARQQQTEGSGKSKAS
jgi:membrane protease YdiL (CAAX protease family)